MKNELIVSADFLEKAKITASELKIEVAIYLYERKRLTLGQAKRLANLDQIAFQKELAKRNIYINYSIEDFQKDLDNLGVQL